MKHMSTISIQLAIYKTTLLFSIILFVLNFRNIFQTITSMKSVVLTILSGMLTYVVYGENPNRKVKNHSTSIGETYQIVPKVKLSLSAKITQQIQTTKSKGVSVVVTHGSSDRGKEYTVAMKCIVGRDNGEFSLATFRIKDPNKLISANHCEIECDENSDCYRIQDNSTNGTFISKTNSDGSYKWIPVCKGVKRKLTPGIFLKLGTSVILKTFETEDFEELKNNLAHEEILKVPEELLQSANSVSPLPKIINKKPYGLMIIVAADSGNVNTGKVQKCDTVLKLGRFGVATNIDGPDIFTIIDDSKLLSINHCDIYWDQSKKCYMVKDLSINGTYISAPGNYWLRIMKNKATELKPGMFLRLAKQVILKVFNVDEYEKAEKDANITFYEMAKIPDGLVKLEKMIKPVDKEKVEEVKEMEHSSSFKIGDSIDSNFIIGVDI